MSININGRIVAEARVQGVTLAPLLGSYELVFGLFLNVHEEAKAPQRLSIPGAIVSVKNDAGTEHGLGFAQPQWPFEIRQKNSPVTMSPGLCLSLQPGQVAALERIRNGGNLQFILRANGIGSEGEHVQADWQVHVARSDWIKKLSDADARDILLLEVPLPLGSISVQWCVASAALRQADEHLRNGHYRECVRECRAAIEALGMSKFEDDKWAGEALSKFAGSRRDMSKNEREAAIWAAAHHYINLAHHLTGDGQAVSYSQADARLVLTLAAALAGHFREV